VHDQVGPVRGDDDVPDGVCGRGVLGARRVQVAQQPADAAQALDQVRRLEGLPDLARDELQHVPAALVEAQRSWSAEEADRVEVGEEVVHRDRPGTGRPADGVPHPHQAGGDVAADQWHLLVRHAGQRRRQRVPGVAGDYGLQTPQGA
jgi:hypothetical protein